MDCQIKTKLPLFICLIACFTGYALAQVETEIPIADYTFETIEVPGIDFLEVTASNDFGDYAGNTRSADGEKDIAFTLIDGVFTTYDFPDSQKTRFYALGNNGVAAGHYKDSEGLYHGVVLDANGELKQYDFPGAAETHIYGLSDETGALSGNVVDAAGVSHAFSGELTITFPGAVNTYGDFVNAAGAVVGSYTDANGRPHGFIRNPDGSFTTIDVPAMPNLEFLFVNTITDFGVVAFRAKAVNDILRSYLLLPDGILYEVQIPGSVNTVVRNVNQDGSIVGFYDLTDGRRYGFVCKRGLFLSTDNSLFPANTANAYFKIVTLKHWLACRWHSNTRTLADMPLARNVIQGMDFVYPQTKSPNLASWVGQIHSNNAISMCQM